MYTCIIVVVISYSTACYPPIVLQWIARGVTSVHNLQCWRLEAPNQEELCELLPLGPTAKGTTLTVGLPGLRGYGARFLWLEYMEISWKNLH